MSDIREDGGSMRGRAPPSLDDDLRGQNQQASQENEGACEQKFVCPAHAAKLIRPRLLSEANGCSDVSK